jgi:hypothetical protein
MVGIPIGHGHADIVVGVMLSRGTGRKFSSFQSVQARLTENEFSSLALDPVATMLGE